MRVLFLGATGVIGRQVIPQLAADFDLELAALEQSELQDRPVQAVDIRDFEATVALVNNSNVDAVINCAIADYKEYQYDRSADVVHRYNESMI